MADVTAPGYKQMLPTPQRRAGFLLRVRKRTLIEKLDEIFRENIQCPINSDARFLVRPRQFAPVNSAPEKPG